VASIQPADRTIQQPIRTSFGVEKGCSRPGQTARGIRTAITGVNHLAMFGPECSAKEAKDTKQGVRVFSFFMLHCVEAEVVKNERLSGPNYLLTFRSFDIASQSRAGQFLMVSPTSSQIVPSPLLKRPLAVYSVSSERGTLSLFTLLIKTVGEGTARLAALKAGQTANVIGPLGNGFEVEAAEGKTAFLIAGGVGIASCYMLAKDLRKQGNEVHLLYGGRTGDDLILLEDFLDLGVELFLTTDDGSVGYPGRVSKGLEEYMKDYDPRALYFYACGPEPMLQAVSGVAVNCRIPCQISVEARMACGFGVCLGCTVKTTGGHRLACTDGPVFKAADFVWEEQI